MVFSRITDLNAILIFDQDLHLVQLLETPKEEQTFGEGIDNELKFMFTLHVLYFFL